MKETAYTTKAFVRQASMLCFKFKAMHTDDTKYRCHIKIV